jgi:hypothetical protein
MNRMLKLVVIAGLGYIASGCSLLSEYRAVDRAAILNPEGHVVGQKEILKYRGTGEEMTRIAIYTPWRGHDGQIAGYEERTRGGSVIRDLQGNIIGSRWKDLRSRGTNRSEGFAVVMSAPAPRKGAEADTPTPLATLDFVGLAGRL